MTRATAGSGGYGFLSLSIGLCGALYFAAENLAVRPDSIFRSPAVGIVGVLLSAVALFLGQTSYPRVQNLKVYLAGSLTGSLGIVAFLLAFPPAAFARSLPALPAVFVPLLLFLLTLGLALAFLLPDFAKYRTTRAVALSLLLPQLVLLLAIRFAERFTVLTPLAGFFEIPQLQPVIRNGPPFVAGSLLLLHLSIRRGDRLLGGVLAGTALIAGFGSLLRSRLLPAAAVDPLLLCTIALALSAGILVHWFARLEHRVLYDPLLQIYGRTFCEQVLSERSPLDTRAPFGIAMVDIDRFKRINDTLGHQCGDRVLHRVAQTVRREVVPEGIVCRYGGEELAIFFPGKDVKRIKPLLERVRAAVEHAVIPWERTEVRVTVSCGASYRRRNAEPLEQVVAEADRALYKAKEGGRNRVVACRTREVRSTV